MNKAILIGRLTKDPELRYGGANNDMAVVRFTLAVPRMKKHDGTEVTDFPTCTVFGKQAESLAKYCKKGRQLAIEGRIQTGKFTGHEGQTVYTTDVVVDRVEFLAEPKGEKPREEQPNYTPYVNDYDIPF